jgi:hypothetical protein
MAFFLAAVAIIQVAPSRVSMHEMRAPVGIKET